MPAGPVVGLDLAKSVFTVHGVDTHRNTTLRKTVRRTKRLVPSRR